MYMRTRRPANGRPRLVCLAPGVDPLGREALGVERQLRRVCVVGENTYEKGNGATVRHGKGNALHTACSLSPRRSS